MSGKLGKCGRAALAVLLVVTAWAAPVAGQRQQQQSHVDLGRTKDACLRFEEALNVAVQRAIPHPLFLTAKAQGAFVEGYGVVFQFTVNLGRGYVLFASQQSLANRNAVKVEVENQRTLLQLKESILLTLWQNRPSLSSLPSGGNVCIIAHLLNVPSGRQDSSKRILVVTIKRSDLAAPDTASASAFEEFSRKVKCIDY